MALDQHFKDMYSDAITELAGFQFKNRLREYMQTDSVGGDHAWFDSYARVCCTPTTGSRRRGRALRRPLRGRSA